MKHEDRSNAERVASHFAALNRIGIALSSELNETRLLHLIAETARDLTGADFAAFTLRPVNELGQPLVAAEGNLFYLAAVVGVTQEEEALLRRMPLGGEGLLAPIFRHGVPVRVPDALALLHQADPSQLERAQEASSASRDAARQAAFDYVHGQIPREGLRYLGVPRGHPQVRSFLGAPLLDRQGQVIGGLLLGHTQPGKFSDEDEALLAGLAAQAAVALENARLVLANRAAATVWGVVWPPGQPMGEFLRENHIRIFAVDGRPLTSGQLATLRAVRQGETVHQHQEIIRHADGATLPVLVNAVALDAQTLNVLPADAAQHEARAPEKAALVVHQDVTALKEAEHLKDEFLGIAAHELRTPLAILRGFAQTLIVQTARGRGTELAEWQMESVEGIDQSTSRLIELTEDWLDVTRLQAGRITFHREPTDQVALARRVVARLQMTTERHHLSLLTSLEYLVVDVDPRRIEQVLTNLIGNAIKYSPAGGPIEVTVREEVETKMALLSIRDSGIGIPVQQHARIFGRFERADNARADGIGGTGLGLYICRELVERHGGRIWFESAEGQGSTFFITLPTLNDASTAYR